MPKWIAWFTIILIAPIIVWIEYEAFFGKDPNPAAGIVTGFIMLGTMVMMLLLGYRKLPYMIIEEE